MSKVYIDIGTNSLGGFEKIQPMIGITNEWFKIFVEPNPELSDYLQDRVSNMHNAVFYSFGVGGDRLSGEMDYLTRNDIKGDSAGTVMGLKFITDSIGSVNQQNPAYNSYKVKVEHINNLLKNYVQHEVYIKMDCEGAEYDILKSLSLYNASCIRGMWVEFHAHDEVMRDERDFLIARYAQMGIELKHWD